MPPEKRRRYDDDFRAGAVGIVRETNKSVSQVAKDLGINPGTLTSWVTKDKLARGERLDLDKVDPRPSPRWSHPNTGAVMKPGAIQIAAPEFQDPDH